ncbi:MAG: S-layer homology domain-containing protein [Clostridium sp.]
MNKKINSLILAGVISVSVCAPAYANTINQQQSAASNYVIEEKEPNDMMSQAQEIKFNTKVHGFKGDNDEDFFKFMMPSDTTLHIDINVTDRGHVNIYDKDGRIMRVFKATKGDNKIKTSLSKGTYYIVTKDSTISRSYEYNFKLTLDYYFKDTKDHWAEKQINEFYNLGYIGGYADGTFRPNNSITRAEFVKMLNSTFGLTKFSGKYFSDIENHWARKDIDIAVTNGICSGKTATEFKPNDLITREEAATMISNYKKIKDSNHDKVNKFYDNKSVSSWAKDSVEGVIEKGYMQGYEDNTFKPKEKITRAEAISTLSRVK